MNDMLKRLEDRKKNLSNSILKIRGAIVMVEKELDDSNKILSETIGRQKELDEMIAELKNMGDK